MRQLQKEALQEAEDPDRLYADAMAEEDDNLGKKEKVVEKVEEGEKGEAEEGEKAKERVKKVRMEIQEEIYTRKKQKTVTTTHMMRSANTTMQQQVLVIKQMKRKVLKLKSQRTLIAQRQSQVPQRAHLKNYAGQSRNEEHCFRKQNH